MIELLWPNFEEEKAYSQLYTAIYHVRKALNQYSNYFKIVNMGDGYALQTENIMIDLQEWEKQLEHLPSVSEETIEAYENYMTYYDGGYLQEYDYLWKEAESHRLERLWIKKAYQLSDYYYERKDWDKAEKWYVSICLTRPEEDDAHFSLMNLYEKLGLTTKVKRQYDELKQTMDELHLPINANIQKWFKNFQKNHPKLNSDYKD